MVEDDEDSLGSTDLFDPPKSALAMSKPLLAAAIKAREQADQLELQDQTQMKGNINLGEHLDSVKLPNTIIEEDETSLESAKDVAKVTKNVEKVSVSEAAMRKSMIETELNGIIDEMMKSEDFVEEDQMEKEAYHALMRAAKEICYTRKYYDVSHDKIIYFPSIIKTIVNMDLFEKAEEYYFDNEEEFPAAYSMGLRTIAFDRMDGEGDADGADEGMDDDMIERLSSIVQLKESDLDELQDAIAAAEAEDQEEAAKQSGKVDDASLSTHGDTDEKKQLSRKWSVEETTYGMHLRDLNQPAAVVEDDEESLGSEDLFDPPKSALAMSKPLLAAAIKAREQADELDKIQQAQPATIMEEDEEESDAKSKSDSSSSSSSDSSSSSSSSSSDSSSSSSAASKDIKPAPVDGMGIFDQSELSFTIEDTEVVPFIPLDMGTAIEREELAKRNVTLGDHLEGMNQPKNMVEDDEDSLGSTDLFDPPKSGLAKSKPLLAAAIKAREQADQLERMDEANTTRAVSLGEHLAGLNQPKTIVEEDEDSLGSTDLFDPPKSALATSRPLLAAAMKARQQADKLEQEENSQRNASLGEHLVGLNQPSMITEEDEDSLGSNELFDPPKSALAKSKPLLAAAIKAREQQDHHLGQPSEIQFKIFAIDEEKSSDIAEEKLMDPIGEEGEESSESSLVNNTNGNSTFDSAEDPSTVYAVPDIQFFADDSSLSIGELDELEYLFQAFDDGEEYDKKRLYDLDLIAKFQAGYELDEDEKFDLGIIMPNRRKERAYRKEFQLLLDEKESGKPVDEDRLLFLELFARRHLGETLTDDELGYLLAVEEEEMLLR